MDKSKNLQNLSYGEILEYLNGLKIEIDKKIEDYLPRKANNKWIEEIFGKRSYILKKAIQGAILDPIWDFLDRGGKRWRPALFLLILEGLGEDSKKFFDFAIIPEIIHNGTLIVDDVQDQGELRRGRPCLHKIFGVDIALNAGNFLYFLPIYILKKNKKKLGKEVYLKILETYLEEMEKLHIGQGTDIFWHKGKEKKISEEEYLKMCAFKTGCMAGLAAKLAVILAKKEKNVVEKIGNFAQNLGVVFQIQDDILDIELSEKEREKFGKSFGNDIKEGKRSLMVVYTLKKAKKKERERLIEILDKKKKRKKEVLEAISIIKKYNSIEFAKEKAREIVEKSWKEVEKLFSFNKAREQLKELIYFLVERKL
jgi:geranylgeranyl diphosphate synthase type I